MSSLSPSTSTSEAQGRSARRARAPRSVSGRAVALGLVLVPLLCAWSLKQELIHGGSEFVEASLIVIAVFVLFVLGLLNEALRRRAPQRAFSQGELLTVYTMLTVSLGVAGLGGMQVLPQVLGAAFYFGGPENGWDRFHPLIPSWLVPDQGVLEAFYKGNSTLFTRAHLAGWSMPIVAWSAFLMALLGAMFCLNVVLRKPWVEQERLTFPLIYLPLELTRGETSRSLMRRRSFWAAFLLVCVLRSITGLHHLVPSFPDLAEFDEEGQSFSLDEILVERPWNAIGYSRLSFHPMIVGPTYFLPLEIAFSAWFLYLLVKAESVLVAAFGWDPGGGRIAHPPYTPEQGAGAFLMIAALSLASAAPHLAGVWRKAFWRDARVDDRGEPLSYRAAVFGFLRIRTGSGCSGSAWVRRRQGSWSRSAASSSGGRSTPAGSCWRTPAWR